MFSILDLCCKAGGSAIGLHRAGFRIVGVDKDPQPNYPFEFIQGDALEVSLDGFDAYWASPPCQKHSTLNSIWKRDYPDIIVSIRNRLISTGKPYIIENVIGAPLKNAVMLCGQMFGLGIFRHRLFESNVLLMVPPHQKHNGRIGENGLVTVAGHGSLKRQGENYLRWPGAMGISHMTRNEIVEAIPPAYSEYLGLQLIKYMPR